MENEKHVVVYGCGCNGIYGGPGNLGDSHHFMRHSSGIAVLEYSGV
jgi:hypothetical protein